MQEFLKKIIVEAGQIAIKFYDRGNVTVATKSYERDFVTEADIAVNDFLVDAIRKEYPDHQITSEELEEPINKGAPYEWVIDPIDGTSNFVDGIPLWGVIIALIQDWLQRLGGFYPPYCRDLHFAKKGAGALLNEHP